MSSVGVLRAPALDYSIFLAMIVGCRGAGKLVRFADFPRSAVSYAPSFRSFDRDYRLALSRSLVLPVPILFLPFSGKASSLVGKSMLSGETLYVRDRLAEGPHWTRRRLQDKCHGSTHLNDVILRVPIVNNDVKRRTRTRKYVESPWASQAAKWRTKSGFDA